MNYKKLVVSDFAVNCYLVYTENSMVVADPGGDAGRIINAIDALSVPLKAILLTHGHFDHVGAVKAIKDKYNVPIVMGKADEYMVEDPAKNVSAMFGLDAFDGFKADKCIEDGEVISFGDLEFIAYKTPGHTPGCVSYLGDGLILSGDTLFKNSIGRCDFPGGDMEELMRSVDRVFMPLDDDIVILPGHNDVTDVGTEKRTNMYILHYLKK